MNAWLTKLLPAALLLGLAAAPAPAAPTVKDEGNLVSEKTEQEANAIIADIQKQFKKEVHVEAYNKPPANKADEFQKRKGDKAYREQFFRTWVQERFQATKTNGLLILIYRESPRGYYVEI